VRTADGKMKTVPMTDLPVVLPALDAYKPTADGQPPLARATEWVNTVDPETGAPAQRETNTMPQWAGSCWYFLRFCDPTNDQEAWSKEAEAYWMPVDLYVGGAEHAVLHLLYSRFWHKVLYDAGLVSTKEPFQKLFNQGMILAYSYRDEQGKFYYPHQVKKEADQWVVKETGVPVQTQAEKMSKSRYNVVNPDDVVRQYGADSLRLYEMFMGPLDREKPWVDEGVQGVHRFLKRVFALYVGEDGELNTKIVASGGSVEVTKALHKMIKAVKHDIEHLLFNTAIARMMEFLNAAGRAERVDRATLEQFVLVLAPFAPHLAEELWARLGHGETLAYAAWPQHDESLLVEDTVEIVVQVLGKVRGKITVGVQDDEEAVLAAALAEERVVPHLAGKQIVKQIYVAGRLVNFIVR
jgi:leucyl-tRNA synthetase